MKRGGDRVPFFPLKRLFVIAKPEFLSLGKIYDRMLSYAHVLPSNPGIHAPIKALLQGEKPVS
jgi:hypothetical protein